MGSDTPLTVFGCYRVKTTAGRCLDVMFRGKHGTRLCFTNLDAPYQDIPLRGSQITSIRPLTAREGGHR